MSDSSFSSGTPQFSTAEYASKGGPDRCKSCNQPIGDTYYRVNGALACPNCAQLASRNVPKDSHAAFVRGVTFGIGGAILGMILYAAFGILTGLVIGYVALGVGYIVAKAITMGSKGVGGQRYQIAAAVLTYIAVSTAAIPMGIAQYLKVRDARVDSAQAQRLQNLPTEGTPSADTADLESSADSNAATRSSRPAATHHASLLGVLGSLLLAGLASPFMELWTNGPSPSVMIGLLILLVGIRIAWKMTDGSGMTSVLGPFKS